MEQKISHLIFISELCPVDRVKFNIVVANIAVAEQVGEILIHCRYGCKRSPDGSGHVIDPLGCPATMRVNSRKEHEKDCPYAPVSCPNNPECPPLLRRDLQAHLDVCEHVTCPHARFG